MQPCPTPDFRPLGREGRLAAQSPNESRRLWAAWVAQNAERFLAVLQPGERLVGEWLALAHGTRYALRHEPFVAFDLMREGGRLAFDSRGDSLEVMERLMAGGFGRSPWSLEKWALPGQPVGAAALRSRSAPPGPPGPSGLRRPRTSSARPSG